MGTTRIKVIDLASSEKEIKTSRKHAEKLAGASKLKEDKKEITPNNGEVLAVEPVESEEQAATPETPSVNEQEATKEETKDAKKDSKKTTRSTSHHQGKNYKKVKELLEDKEYTIQEALEILPKTSYVKFDPTVEVHLSVSDKNMRGSVAFPHLKAEVKEKKYLIFADKKIETDKKVIFFHKTMSY